MLSCKQHIKCKESRNLPPTTCLSNLFGKMKYQWPPQDLQPSIELQEQHTMPPIWSKVTEKDNMKKRWRFKHKPWLSTITTIRIHHNTSYLYCAPDCRSVSTASDYKNAISIYILCQFITFYIELLEEKKHEKVWSYLTVSRVYISNGNKKPRTHVCK